MIVFVVLFYFNWDCNAFFRYIILDSDDPNSEHYHQPTIVDLPYTLYKKMCKTAFIDVLMHVKVKEGNGIFIIYYITYYFL